MLELSIFEAKHKETHSGTVKVELMWINDGAAGKGLRLFVWGPASQHIDFTQAELQGHGAAAFSTHTGEEGPVQVADFPDFEVPAGADFASPMTTAGQIGASMFTTFIEGTITSAGTADLHIGLSAIGDDYLAPHEMKLTLKP